MQIAGRKIGPGEAVFIVAELSGNHGGLYDEVVRLIYSAKECGADAVKLQVYEPDEMPDKDDLVDGYGSDWDGRIWVDVYRQLHLPWYWVSELQRIAGKLGIILFSTVCSKSDISYLPDMPAYKIPYWAIRDQELIKAAIRTYKPILVSVLNEDDIKFVHCCTPVVLVRDINQVQKGRGYSNHGDTKLCSLAVDLGSCVIEQHFTLNRNSIDGKFAAMPDEFKEMVKAIREVEKCGLPT